MSSVDASRVQLRVEKNRKHKAPVAQQFNRHQLLPSNVHRPCSTLCILFSLRFTPRAASESHISSTSSIVPLMPATRAGTRQGSRQPAPYPQDVAGPSNQTIEVFLVDDEGPHRKRQAVERKSAKQRSKQKAKAPLPPASEIIEISSDDDELPPKKPSLVVHSIEKRVKELEEVRPLLRCPDWGKSLIASTF